MPIRYYAYKYEMGEYNIMPLRKSNERIFKPKFYNQADVIKETVDL